MKNTIIALLIALNALTGYLLHQWNTTAIECGAIIQESAAIVDQTMVLVEAIIHDRDLCTEALDLNAKSADICIDDLSTAKEALERCVEGVEAVVYWDELANRAG